MTQSPATKSVRTLPTWASIAVVILLLGVAYFVTRQERAANEPAALPPPVVRSSVRTAPQPAESQQAESRPHAATTAKPSAGDKSLVRDVTIRDEDRDVVYRGDVDLTPTLERIDAGRKLRFSNDGSTFQNREGRLPRQASGYYQEWVHPTPGLSGPGPQRIVTGEEGEAFYTPDHYRTFQRIR